MMSPTLMPVVIMKVVGAPARGAARLQRQQKPQPQLQPGARSALQRAPATMDSRDAAVMGSMTKRSTSFDSTFSKQCALPCVPQSGAEQTRRLRGGSQQTRAQTARTTHHRDVGVHADVRPVGRERSARRACRAAHAARRYAKCHRAALARALQRALHRGELCGELAVVANATKEARERARFGHWRKRTAFVRYTYALWILLSHRSP
jgi:hypothetical protein